MTNTVSSIVDDETLDAIIQIESAGNPAAKNPLSTARGLGQFLKGTWRDVVKKHRPDVYNYYAKDLAKLDDLRTSNPSFSIEMLARFTEDNLKTIGGKPTPGDLYLAHFLGAGAARDAYRALATDPLSKFLGAKVFDQNPFLVGKTAGWLRNWAETKMAKALKSSKGSVAKYYKNKFKVPMTPHDEFSSRNVMASDPSRPGLKIGGDPRLWDNQQQLKSMNYNPGNLDGVWGGGTAGALAAFLNDVAPDVRPPTTWSQYDRDYGRIDETIDREEDAKWKRPVTKSRREADPTLVETVAPEIVPAKRSLWGSIAAFFSAFGTAVYQFFSWLFDWKDTAEEWRLMDYVGQVPAFVWVLLASGVLGFLVYTTIRTDKGIERPVTTGERM